jgi:hypothetical protein
LTPPLTPRMKPVMPLSLPPFRGSITMPVTASSRLFPAPLCHTCTWSHTHTSTHERERERNTEMTGTKDETLSCTFWLLPRERLTLSCDSQSARITLHHVKESRRKQSSRETYGGTACRPSMRPFRSRPSA